jgi:hypothetical protein
VRGPTGRNRCAFEAEALPTNGEAQPVQLRSGNAIPPGAALSARAIAAMHNSRLEVGSGAAD